MAAILGSIAFYSGSGAVPVIFTHEYHGNPTVQYAMWICEYCMCGNEYKDGTCKHCGAPAGYSIGKTQKRDRYWS
jgi:hypothetical protein